MIIVVCLLCTLVHIPTLVLRFIPFREKVARNTFLSLLFCYGIGLVLNFIFLLWFTRSSALTVSVYKYDLLIFCTITGIINILSIPGYFREKEQINKQLELQKKYYDALTTTVENEQAVRQSLKHHLTIIQGFLKNKNIDALHSYCNDLEGTLADIKEIPYTGNAAVDGLLYHYACIAEKEQIEFTVCCKLNHLSISDTDLCCLLGNALDNALTACKNCKKKRYISLASEKEANMLLLTIDNSFDGTLLTENGKILSRKQNPKSEHSLFQKSTEGSGIHSMEQICAKYDGACRFHAEMNRFEASFMLIC